MRTAARRLWGSILSPTAINLRDDFNRANSATTMGSTSVGNKPWVPFNPGVFGISSNQAVYESGITAAADRVTAVECASGDGHLSCVVSTLATDGNSIGAGLIARMTAADLAAGVDSNYIYFGVNSNAGSPCVVLKAVVGGVTTTLYTLTGSTIAPCRLDLYITSGTLTAFLNGTQVYSGTPSLPAPTRTYHGIISGTTSSLVDSWNYWPTASVATTSIDVVSSDFTHNSPTATWSHTCSSDTTMLVVGVAANVSAYSPTTVTYNGVSLTNIGVSSVGGGLFVAWYALYLPDTGAAHNIIVTGSSSGYQMLCVAASLKNCTFAGNLQGSSSTSATSRTVTVSSNANGLVLSYAGIFPPATITNPAGSTQLADGTNAGQGRFCSQPGTGSNVTVTYSESSSANPFSLAAIDVH